MGPHPVVPAARLRSLAPKELERVLASPEFRQSEQSKRLLRYLVEESLEGRQDTLRERAIGVAVFGLEAGYDTNMNPIVRVRANELRKRLAKYYQHAEPGGLRLDVPAGAYRVEFRTVPAVEPSARPTVSASSPMVSRLKWVYAAAALAVICVLGLLAVRKTGSTRDTLDAFWEPALQYPAPVIICSGHPVVYRFTRAFAEKIRGSAADHYQTLTEALLLNPDQVLHGRDIVPVRDQYIGLGSAEAVARVHGWLARKGKDSDIRFGNDLTFSELRKAPAVVIGAFQNRWTLEFTRGLRFVFETLNGVPGIRDTLSGKVWSLPQLQENGHTTEDYVVISRILKSSSGEFVVAAAGITQYGGHTVGEVLSNPALLKEALASASGEWGQHNMQLLYHVRIVGATAGPPELVAMHEW